MTYDYIVNPESGRKVSLFTSKGKSILKNYLSQAQMGGAPERHYQKERHTQRQRKSQQGGDYDGRCKGLYKKKGNCEAPPEGCRQSRNRWGPMCTPEKGVRNKRKSTKAPRSPRSPGSKREYKDPHHHQRYHGTSGASECSEDDAGDKRGEEWCKQHEAKCRWVDPTAKRKGHCKIKRGSNSPAFIGSTLSDDDLHGMFE